MSEGLTGGDLWAMEQLFIKANDEQLFAIRKALDSHIARRGMEVILVRR